MKNTVFSRVKLLFAAALAASTLLLAGCNFNQNNALQTDLNGTWSSSNGESYTIDKAAGTFDSGSYSYAGDNMEIVEYSDTAGTIFFKYTRAFETVYTEPEDASSWAKYEYWYNTTTTDTKYVDPKDDSYTYNCSWSRCSSTAPAVGKWYAISYKDLTAASVSISGAYKEGGKTYTDTLEEAKEEFTIENGYFSYYSDCSKK